MPLTTDAEAFGRVARASDRVLVRLAEPGAEQRRALASFVIAGTESELDRRGAAPRGWAAGDTLEEVVRDQLYRARLLGCFGIAVSFAPVSSLADPGGRLSAEDSETLHRLFALAEREPLQLYLPRPSAELLIAGAPQPLSAWLPPSLEPGRVATIEYDPASESELASGNAATFVIDSGAEVTLIPPPVEAFVEAARSADTRRPESEPQPERACTPDADAAVEVLAAGQPERAALDGDAAQTPFPPAVVAAPGKDGERAERCLAWAAQLQAMSGPKVHGSVEKAFIGAYLPLCRELAAGGAPEPARQAAERWAEGFAQSYASAFRQLGGGARRPRMVRDVVELGSRWLSQNHARQCQLLLVSAMRFDLGQRLNEEIERRLMGKAVCVEQSVLWTALPSNSEAQQLGEALGLAHRRGRPDTTPRAPAGEIESGYVGSRELFRLRQLPAELANPGEVETARLQRIATELADTLVPWIQRQPPDTLVVLFGDHGFHWEANVHGTSVAQRGGALPEQVLVPASAWLLREPRARPKTAAGVH